jgi:hypothetical protein
LPRSREKAPEVSYQGPRQRKKVAKDSYQQDPLVAGTDLHYIYRLPAPEAPGAVRIQTGPLERDDRPGTPPAR